MKQFVKFTVDTDTSAMDLRAASLPFQRRLIDLWAKYGVLHLQGDTVEIKELISHFPGSSKKLWQNAIRNKKKYRRVSNSLQDNNPDYLEITNDVAIDILLNHMDLENLDLLCFLDEQKLDDIKISEDETSLYNLDKDLEVCHVGMIDQSSFFKNAERLSTTPISRGENVNEIWVERFSDIATLAKNVVIVDRYALHHIETEKRDENGLINFLTKLDAESKGAYVTVYIQSEGSIIDERRRYILEDRWNEIAPTDGIKEINLRPVPYPVATDWAHDRCIRFDGTVVELGLGVGIFKFEVISQLCSYTLMVNPKAYNLREQELERRSREYKLDGQLLIA